MDKTIMQKKRAEMRREFLRLTPLQRIRKMNTLFNDMIALKAKTRGVREYEIYRKYIEARKRDRKLKNLLERDEDSKEEEDKSQLI